MISTTVRSLGIDYVVANSLFLVSPIVRRGIVLSSNSVVEFVVIL